MQLAVSEGIPTPFLLIVCSVQMKTCNAHAALHTLAESHCHSLTLCLVEDVLIHAQEGKPFHSVWGIEIPFPFSAVLPSLLFVFLFAAVLVLRDCRMCDSSKLCRHRVCQVRVCAASASLRRKLTCCPQQKHVQPEYWFGAYKEILFHLFLKETASIAMDFPCLHGEVQLICQHNHVCWALQAPRIETLACCSLRAVVSGSTHSNAQPNLAISLAQMSASALMSASAGSSLHHPHLDALYPTPWEALSLVLTSVSPSSLGTTAQALCLCGE